METEYLSLPYYGALNQEILRSRALMAQLRANHTKARELCHTLTNLLTVRFLLLDAIHQSSRQARHGRLRLRRARPTRSVMRRNYRSRQLTVLQALAILEAVMLQSWKSNINTGAIRAALGILERSIQPTSLISELRCHLQKAAEEIDKPAQEQELRVVLFQVRDAVAEVVRRKRDSLALKFHDTCNPMIKQEIDLLGRELVKLETSLDFSEKQRWKPARRFNQLSTWK